MAEAQPGKPELALSPCAAPGRPRTLNYQLKRIEEKRASPSSAPDGPTPSPSGKKRCARLVDDVEALREHLGLDQMDPLAPLRRRESRRALREPPSGNVNKLALITPSVGAVGLTITDLWLETAQLRRNETWFPEAFAALEAIVAGKTAAAPDITRTALAQFTPPVLLLAGEANLGAPPHTMAEFAGLFPNTEFVVQHGAGHYP